MERYFFVIINESVACDDKGNRQKFNTEHAAAESAWNAIRDGHDVRTADNITDSQTRWKYDWYSGAIIGESD